MSVALFAVVLAGCGRGGQVIPDAGSDADTDTDIDTDTDTDTATATATDTGTGTETDSETDTDTSPCAPEDTVPPAIVLGGGETAYSNLECLQPLEIFTGPQGCCHFYGAIKGNGIVTDPPARYAYQVVDEFGEHWADFGPGELLDPTGWAELKGEPGWTAVAGLRIIMSLSGPEDVQGKQLEATVRLVDGAGASYEDTHLVMTFFP